MVNAKDIPPEAILLAVYLELQNGDTYSFRTQLLSIPAKMSTFFFFFLRNKTHVHHVISSDSTAVIQYVVIQSKVCFENEI